jgi:hypothetical protein
MGQMSVVNWEFRSSLSKGLSEPPRSAVALASAKHLFRRFSFVSFSFAPAVSKEKRKAIQNVFK